MPILTTRAPIYLDRLQSIIEKCPTKAITSTCHEVLGHKKHYHKEWITVDTLDKIQERRNKKAVVNTSRIRAEKAKAQAEYTDVNNQVKRSISTDKA
ncbi:unnamed protein product [Schistosoma margrebowiei]|uniref:Uncharacterized protein n=1 Tax=Schistosoma margrebowiei TaxID=48269 RepID=A0A183MG61_9TREM|nr:unnamed protein product [Schistosoma margrebowiei]